MMLALRLTPTGRRSLTTHIAIGSSIGDAYIAIGSAIGDALPEPVSKVTANPVEDPSTNSKLVEILTSKLGAPCTAYSTPISKGMWTTLCHEPTPTSEDSARVRGATLASGAKAMLLSTKPNDEMVLAVISAAAKMDSKAFKKVGGFRSTRFASEQEVWGVTGCVRGAVPPMGSCFSLRTFVDQSLLDQGCEINFNAGLRTVSVRMMTEDYLEIERPTICSFKE